MRHRIAAVMLALLSAPAFAGAVSTPSFFPVPTLDDLGLAGLTLAVGIVGGIAARMRRRK